MFEKVLVIFSSHILFRRPTLDRKVLESTKDDGSIEKVPESCIEKFNLYVSTWEG